MKYRKSEAKEYARKHITGLWGASFTTYTPNYTIDEDAWRFNVRHYIDNLQLEGLFVCGTMAEYWYLGVAERKRILQLAVEEAKGKMLIMPYTYDLVVDNEIEMIRYAEENGADLVVTSQPAFPVGDVPNDEGVFQRFKYISDRTNIGIAIFNAPYQGYFMSPQLASRIADLPNIIAIKNMGDFGALRRMRIACGEKVVVCDPLETQWWTNMTIYGQQALFATYFLHLYQSKHLKLVQEYTDLYRKGEVSKALQACKRLEAVRRACDSVMFHGKMRSAHKYWAQCVGMAGGDGRVRLPQAEVSEQEKRAIRTAAESTELVTR
jgi:4-hydroxy-tetrahydrodipicolinate synthase